MDKNTLIQLRGAGAKGYAFDRRFGQEDTSDMIYESCIAQLVENCFKVRGGKLFLGAWGMTGRDYMWCVSSCPVLTLSLCQQ